MEAGREALVSYPAKGRLEVVAKGGGGVKRVLKRWKDHHCRALTYSILAFIALLEEGTSLDQGSACENHAEPAGVLVVGCYDCWKVFPPFVLCAGRG